MSFRMVNWAYEQDLPPSPKFLLVTLADKADDDGTTAAGVDFLAYETGISTRTVIRHLKQLEAMDLLHKERREYKGFGGRKTNLTILHPWVAGTKPKWHDYKKLQRQAEKTKREFGVTDPVENFESVQGDNLALSSNSGADTQHDNLSHSVHKVTSVHTQGDKSCNFGEVALKERARGFNHQLINHQSVSQSVKSPGSVENFRGSTDRPMKIENSKNPQTNLSPGARGENSLKSPQVDQGGSETSFVSESSPVTVLGSQRGVQGSVGSELGTAGPSGAGGVVAARGSEAAERSHRGVDLERVKATLCHAGIPATSVPAATFVCMIDLVLDRATAPVQSPNGYVTTAMKNGWGELLSKAQSQPGNGAGASSAAVCRQHRCHLSATGECKRCIAEQRAAELDNLHHELVWKKNLTQIDVATLEVSLRHGGYAIDSVPVQTFRKHIMVALNSDVAPTTNDLFRFFADNQEIFTHNAASDKQFAGFGHERTA